MKIKVLLLIQLFLIDMGCGPLSSFESLTNVRKSSLGVDFEKDIEYNEKTGEELALEISRNIQLLHMPYFGSVMDPFYSPDYVTVENYTRAGDSAIWTGHYLAAEAYRWAVTRSDESWTAFNRTLDGIWNLVGVTKTNLLARAIIPAAGDSSQSKYPHNDPTGATIVDQEIHAYICDGVIDQNGQKVNVRWLGNTSRDQYAGIFFGLGAAFDLVDDLNVKRKIADLVFRMTNYLIDNNWRVRMPENSNCIGEPEGFSYITFYTHRYQIGSILQLAMHTMRTLDYWGPFERYEKEFKRLNRFFKFSSAFKFMMNFETTDMHKSYFKFNLAMIYAYNLVRLERKESRKEDLRDAYLVLRKATNGETPERISFFSTGKTFNNFARHKNPHFNMIDRALSWPIRERDLETRQQLTEWMKRNRFDITVDKTQDTSFSKCWPFELLSFTEKDPAFLRSCQALPLSKRIHADFIWQRSPFRIYQGGSARVKGAGIDFILPYWMARYYNIISARVPERIPISIPDRVHDLMDRLRSFIKNREGIDFTDSEFEKTPWFNFYQLNWFLEQMDPSIRPPLGSYAEIVPNDGLTSPMPFKDYRNGLWKYFNEFTND